MKIIIKHLIHFLIFATVAVNAQNVTQQKYQLAQSYESNGDLENAGRIYQELFRDESQNQRYFDAYVRVFKNQNKFSELIDDVNIFLKRQPLPVNYSLLAELYWRTGNIDSANINWQKAIDVAKSPADFKDIAGSQLQLQLFEKAVQTFLTGRNKLENNVSFSDELGRLYIAIGNYKQGIVEIINYMRESNSLGIAQGRIYALLESEGAEEYILDYLRKEVDRNSNDLLLIELYSAFLREIGNYKDALEVTVKLDELKYGQGRQILSFAGAAADEGEYDIAIKAYKMIVNEGKKNKFTPNALMGLTNTLEKAFLQNDDFTDEQAKEVISSYEKIIEDYPNSTYSQQAYLRIGIIAFQKLNDYDIAVEYLNNAIKANSRSTHAADAAIILAELHISRQELAEAKQVLTQIATGRIGGNNKEFTATAQYYLGEIQFFRAEFDAAMKFYSEIAAISDSDMANDALFKIGLINTNKENFKAMNLFATAVYAHFRKDYEEALQKYDEIVQETPSSQLAEIALLRSGEIMSDKEDYPNAITKFQQLITEFPETIFLEKAYFNIASAYMNSGDSDNAIKYFKEILVKFPNSIYLQQSRRNIRKLRNDDI